MSWVYTTAIIVLMVRAVVKWHFVNGSFDASVSSATHDGRSFDCEMQVYRYNNLMKIMGHHLMDLFQLINLGAEPVDCFLQLIPEKCVWAKQYAVKRLSTLSSVFICMTGHTVRRQAEEKQKQENQPLQTTKQCLIYNDGLCFSSYDPFTGFQQ